MKRWIFTLWGLLLFPWLWSADSYIPKYIWVLGIAESCDCHPFKEGVSENLPELAIMNPKAYIKNLKKGDVVWVKSSQLIKFIGFFRQIKVPFILVIAGEDYSFPSSFKDQINIQSLLDNWRLIHVFAQNLDGTFQHPKLSGIPIGIDFHSLVRKEGCFGEKQHSIQQQETVLDDILSHLKPTYLRKKRVFIDFHLCDRAIYGGTTRGAILQELISHGSIVNIDRLEKLMPRHALWRLKGEYAFSISPHGNGLDCHRTWEDLTLGCIVIVKTSALDPLYKGLPVVIVKNWSEITEENLNKWFAQYKDAFTNPEYRQKLTTQYWMNKILDFKRQAI